MLLHSKPKGKTYKCDKCNHTYTREDHYKEHVEKCNTNKINQRKKKNNGTLDKTNDIVYDTVSNELPSTMDEEVTLCMVNEYLGYFLPNEEYTEILMYVERSLRQ